MLLQFLVIYLYSHFVSTYHGPKLSLLDSASANPQCLSWKQTKNKANGNIQLKFRFFLTNMKFLAKKQPPFRPTLYLFIKLWVCWSPLDRGFPPAIRPSLRQQHAVKIQCSKSGRKSETTYTRTKGSELFRSGFEAARPEQRIIPTFNVPCWE